MGRPVTAAMAVDCLRLLNLPEVKPGTIRQWANRGKVKKLGCDQYGSQRYELHDIVREAQATPR